MSNFKGESRVLAAYLLENFSYINSRATDSLIEQVTERLTVQLIMDRLLLPGRSVQDYLDTAIWTPIQGETPAPTDSGNHICARVRHVLQIPESQFLYIDEILAAKSHANGLSSPVLLIDDFIGSGDQLSHTLTRKNGTRSLLELSSMTGSCPIYVLCLVATTNGLRRLNAEFPSLVVTAGYILNNQEVLSRIMRAPKLPDYISTDRIRDLLFAQTDHLVGETHFAQNNETLALGYKAGGVLLSFHRRPPDALLPIFWSRSTRPDWTPLQERT